MRVEVRNNNVDKALKILNELREREFHMTKGEKGRRSKAAAIRRELKNKQKQFEELGF
jgi:ribosomal protein S21